jgi:hypothetical protein
MLGLSSWRCHAIVWPPCRRGRIAFFLKGVNRRVFRGCASVFTQLFIARLHRSVIIHYQTFLLQLASRRAAAPGQFDVAYSTSVCTLCQTSHLRVACGFAQCPLAHAPLRCHWAHARIRLRSLLLSRGSLARSPRSVKAPNSGSLCALCKCPQDIRSSSLLDAPGKQRIIIELVQQMNREDKA